MFFINVKVVDGQLQQNLKYHKVVWSKYVVVCSVIKFDVLMFCISYKYERRFTTHQSARSIQLNIFFSSLKGFLKRNQYVELQS